ncbi:hypothetical protein SPURM210S_03457 [Streptomyces purpurascens]
MAQLTQPAQMGTRGDLHPREAAPGAGPRRQQRRQTAVGGRVQHQGELPLQQMGHLVDTAGVRLGDERDGRGVEVAAVQQGAVDEHGVVAAPLGLVGQDRALEVQLVQDGPQDLRGAPQRIALLERPVRAGGRAGPGAGGSAFGPDPRGGRALPGLVAHPLESVLVGFARGAEQGGRTAGDHRGGPGERAEFPVGVQGAGQAGAAAVDEGECRPGLPYDGRQVQGGQYGGRVLTPPPVRGALAPCLSRAVRGERQCGVGQGHQVAARTQAAFARHHGDEARVHQVGEAPPCLRRDGGVPQGHAAQP